MTLRRVLYPLLVILMSMSLLFGATASATSRTDGLRREVRVVQPMTYPYSPMEVERYWNATHDPNIGIDRAAYAASYLNAAVGQQIVAYLQAVAAAYARALVANSHTDLLYRWQGVANCESGGNWAINTGNGYYGGVQFLLSTWHAVGGAGYPNQASPGEQAYRAEILKNRSGLGQWPVCGRYYR